MIFLEENLNKYSNEEIIELLKINIERKNLSDGAIDLSKQIEELRPDVTKFYEKCNRIIDKQVNISKGSCDYIISESRKMKGKVDDYKSLNKDFNNSLSRETELINAENKIVKSKEEKRTFKQRIFNYFKTNFNLMKENSPVIEEVKIEKIESNLSNLEKKIKIEMTLRSLLDQKLKRKNISQEEYNQKVTNLNSSISKRLLEKENTQKVVEAYYEVTGILESIMNIDLSKLELIEDENEYQEKINNICEDIRLKSTRLNELKEFLSDGLLLSIKNKYKIKVDNLEEKKKEKRTIVKNNSIYDNKGYAKRLAI